MSIINMQLKTICNEDGSMTQELWTDKETGVMHLYHLWPVKKKGDSLLVMLKNAMIKLGKQY